MIDNALLACKSVIRKACNCETELTEFLVSLR